MKGTMNSDFFFCLLPNRGCVRISGADRHGFLQGLLTNDLNKLDDKTVLYACLLTPQGKFLHDFFVREEKEEILLDCEGGERTDDLARRLSLYKLRAQVVIDIMPKAEVFGILESQNFRISESQTVLYRDPRHADMGYRAYEKPPGIPEQPFEDWDYRRISLTIPDGSRDLRIGQSTLEEARMDILNAVNYKKGCYIGQELTARMHYRGLGKKHLYTVQLTADRTALEKHADILSSCRDLALILCRDDKVQHIEKEGFIVTNPPKTG